MNRFPSANPLRYLAVLICVAFGWNLLSGDARAQSCDPNANVVNGTVNPGDGSHPPAGTDPCIHGYNGWDTAQACGPWGKIISMPLGTGTWSLWASTTCYFTTPTVGKAECTADQNGCVSCSGKGFNALLYGLAGDIKGTVVQFPAAKPWNGSVIASCYLCSTPTDAAGTYSFARNVGGSCPGSPNNWGLPVSSDGSRAGTATYDVTVGTYTQTANISSSKATVKNFSLWTPGLLEPECRTCPNVGSPVNLFSGNVFFDQADAEVTGFGVHVRFTRSYNSVNRNSGLYGTFGAGWTHEYERVLSYPLPGDSTVLMLRSGDGTPSYFQDNDRDGRYDPSVPFNADSWIVKQTDGSFIRYFRRGGTESYTSAGILTEMTDPSGNATVLHYTGGRLTSITAPGGRTLTLSYDPSNRISTLSGPAGLIATYTYDAVSRLAGVAYADEAGSGYTFTYDPGTNGIATVADLSGRVLETHTYDGAGRGLTSEIANGQERYTVSYQGSQTVVTDALNNVTTYQFDDVWGEHKISLINGPCDSCGGAQQTQSWTYDDKGRVLTYTDGNGKITSYSYDPVTGDRLTVTDPLGNVTSYTYDTGGRPVTATAPDQGTVTYVQSVAGPTSITDAIGRQTSFIYGTTGLLLGVTKPLGSTTTLSYDAHGDLTAVLEPLQSQPTTFGYDALGRRTTVTDPLNNTTTTAYDTRGQIRSVTRPNGAAVSFSYDAGGRRSVVTDPLHHTTTYAYDPYARLRSVTDALGGVTQYGYDAMSHLTSITDARGRTTTFNYDSFGRVSRVTYPGALPQPFETFTYDLAGHLRTKTDRKSLTISYGYDDVGRLVSKSYSDKITPMVAYGYDRASRLASAANDVDTLTWKYDPAGQLRFESSERNASTLGYVYDADGNRIQLLGNGALLFEYHYDAADRLASIVRSSSGATYGFSYDDASRRAGLTFPNAVQTTYAYDINSHLTALNASAPREGRVTNWQYGYDDADNRLSKTGDMAVDDAYTYDALNRLTTRMRSQYALEAYTYDAVGNRLSSLSDPTWTYDDRNELLSYGSVQLGYDANGNTASAVTSANSMAYLWDAENRLTQATRDGTELARFTYDPIGRRATKISSGALTRYLYDGDDILAVYTPTQSWLYHHGPRVDETLAKEYTWGLTGTFYLHTDGLGSHTSTTDSAGSVVFRRSYDAFGNLGDGSQGEYAFTGREWDPETSLYYYRTRYYDPKLGRFSSEDPIRWSGGENFYAYVKNRPTVFSDPDGRQSAAAYYVTYWQTGVIQTPDSPIREADFYSLICQYFAGQFGASWGEGMGWVPAGGAIGPKGCGCMLTANWLNQSTTPAPNKKRQFATGRSYSLGASALGAVQISWTPGAGTATGIGLGTPGWGLGASYGLCTTCPGPTQNPPPDHWQQVFWRSHGY